MAIIQLLHRGRGIIAAWHLRPLWVNPDVAAMRQFVSSVPTAEGLSQLVELRKTHWGLLTGIVRSARSIVGRLNRKVVRRISDEETL